MTRAPEQVKESRTAVREKYGALFEHISELLFEADPIQINFKFNTDEYEPEVEAILDRLDQAKNQTDAVEVVHQVFCHWFSSDDAGPREKYETVAAQIWKDWCAFKSLEV